MAASGIQKVAIVGSGNWGSAIARIVGQNTPRFQKFENKVRMWVYEEMVNERKLTEIINTEHENVKYLPGIKLPENVVAVPDLKDAVSEASVLVFVLPHQFLPRLLPTIKENMDPKASAITLIKGIDYDENGIVLVSDVIRDGLGINVSALMGANVANEVAEDQFCEATVGCSDPDVGAMFRDLFDTSTFKISVVNDAKGVEICGALKNIVALGAGFVDALGYGGNTKAALIRLGLMEMKKFSQKNFDGIKDETFLESCGIADLITTCYGGRNRRCAEAFVRSGKSWDVLESELLGGQKLQGTLAAQEVHKILVRQNATEDFPLFETIYQIAFEGMDAKQLFMHGVASESTHAMER